MDPAASTPSAGATALDSLRALAAEWRSHTVVTASMIPPTELLRRLDSWRTTFEALDHDLLAGGQLPSGWGRPPRIEVVGMRDPDAATEIVVFVDGVETEGCQVTIADPGAGHQLEGWRESRDGACQAASPAAGAVIRQWFTDCESSPYIEHPYAWQSPQHDGEGGHLCSHSDTDCEQEATRCPAGHPVSPVGRYRS